MTETPAAREALKVALRRCRVEDGSPAPKRCGRGRPRGTEALREAAEEIERELICCDAYERGDWMTPHQICYWAGASRQLVLDRAALTTGAPDV